MWVGAQGVIKPRYEMASWRKAFGMSSAEAVAVLDAIRAALDGEPLTRDELADAVAEQLGDARLGEAVRGSFGTMPKLAAFRGDVVFAPPAGQRVRFTRPDRWLGDGWRPDAAARRRWPRSSAATSPSTARRRARRSRAGSGCRPRPRPASSSPRSATRWRRSASRGRRAGCCATTSRRPARHGPTGSSRCCRRFDQYVVAAPRDDSPVLAAEHKARVYRPQGWLSPVLLVDGRIAGVWRHERKGGGVSVAIEPFAVGRGLVRAGAEREARRLAAFLDGELELSWECGVAKSSRGRERIRHSAGVAGASLPQARPRQRARGARRPRLVRAPRLRRRGAEQAVEGEQAREAVADAPWERRRRASAAARSGAGRRRRSAGGAARRRSRRRPPGARSAG